MEESKTKDIKELPDGVCLTLYHARYAHDKKVPYDEYKKRFTCVEYDGILYYDTKNEFEVRRMRHWCIGGINRLTTPDAVLAGEHILKNRYGHRS